MITGSVCIPVAMPPDLSAIDDERKAIYHSTDTVCVWVFVDRQARNRFLDETVGMTKAQREAVFDSRYRSDG